MREIPIYIDNHQAVVEAFGYWPAFHDAHVSVTWGEDWVRLDLQAWEMTSETDEHGYFKLIKRHDLGLRFTGVTGLRSESLLPDNILFELDLSPVAEFEHRGTFRVGIDSAMGGDVGGSFEARGAR